MSFLQNRIFYRFCTSFYTSCPYKFSFTISFAIISYIIFLELSKLAILM